MSTSRLRRLQNESKTLEQYKKVKNFALVTETQKFIDNTTNIGEIHKPQPSPLVLNLR